MHTEHQEVFQLRGKNRIREIIDLNNIAPKSIAIDAGVSYSELMKIINHEISPRFETMILITEALKKDIWDVFYY